MQGIYDGIARTLSYSRTYSCGLGGNVSPTDNKGKQRSANVIGQRTAIVNATVRRGMGRSTLDQVSNLTISLVVNDCLMAAVV